MLTALSMLLTGALLAAADPSQVPQVAGPFQIDAILDEPQWLQALRVDLAVQTRPGENTAAPVATEVRLIDTGRSLMVSFVASDPDPTAIRAFFRDRDSAYQDDFVGVVLDTFNDERRALEFFVNPYGAQMDMIMDDVNGNEDDSWDAIWSSAGQVTDQGFVVELEIPYSAMQLPDGDGEKIWGIDLLRFYPRDYRYRLSNNRQDRAINCYLCQIQKFRGFAQAQAGNDLEITPTLTITQSENRDEVTDTDLIRSDVDVAPGLDVSWGITPNITLNGTLNPDFSQVEADAAQLDVNRNFALFFPERRPFFQEGADFFDTPISAVYTRSVVDPDVGVRVTGKAGNNALGLFIARDAVTNFLIPGPLSSDFSSIERDSTNAVLRYRRDVLDSSSVGILVTARQGEGYSNYVAGVDGQLRLSASDTLTFQYLDSQTLNPTQLREEFALPLRESGGSLYAQWDHEERDWFANLRFEDIDDQFRADLGFLFRNDFDRAVAGGGYRWYGAEDDWWTRIQINGDWDITHDNAGRVLEREVEAYASVQGPLQSYVSVGAGQRDRLWNEVLFTETYQSFYGEIQPRSGISIELYVQTGDQVDFANTRLGQQLRVNPEVSVSLGKHLSLDIDHNYQKLKRDAGDIFTANVTDLRIAYQFDLRQRLRLTLQYNDVKRNPALHEDDVNSRETGLGAQLIYSYKVNPRTVLFAGYSGSGLQTDDVASRVTTGRTLFVKLGYAWEPDF